MYCMPIDGGARMIGSLQLVREPRERRIFQWSARANDLNRLNVVRKHTVLRVSAVTLTKTDLRNRMGHELLVAILIIKFALRMRGITSAEFQVPRDMVEKVNNDIYQ